MIFFQHSVTEFRSSQRILCETLCTSRLCVEKKPTRNFHAENQTLVTILRNLYFCYTSFNLCNGKQQRFFISYQAYVFFRSIRDQQTAGRYTGIEQYQSYPACISQNRYRRRNGFGQKHFTEDHCRSGTGRIRYCFVSWQESSGPG